MWYSRGVALNNLGQNAEAINSCDKAIAIKPDYAVAWNSRGVSLHNLGRYTDAVGSYDKALAIKPDYAVTWNSRGVSLHNLGRYTDAVGSYDKALAIKPDYVEAWSYRGVALHNLGQYADAVDSFDKAIAIKTDYSYAWKNRGNTLIELKRYDEALSSFERAIQLDPHDELAIAGKKELLNKIGSEKQQNREKEDREKEDRRNLILFIKEAESFGLLPHSIKDAVQQPEVLIYPDEVLSIISQLSEFLNTARPKINLVFSCKQIPLSTWEKEKISVTNEGSAHAKNITFEFSDDLDVRRIKSVDVLAGETKQVEMPIKAKVKGIIPLDITITYHDARDNVYSDTFNFDIEVIEKGTTAPSPVDRFDPKPLTPKQLPPDLSDRYTESEFIGKGGFARVFKAKRKDGKYVAVKIPISMDSSTGKSFIAEMQNWTKLSHPNIVRLYDFNIMPMPFFEEELCDSALSDQKKPIESEKAAWILFNICEGLKFAHKQKILHRDLKPQNILLKEGVPKISDWGLSRIISESSTTTSTSFTPHYAAPEQINSRVKDESTDIWQSA